MLSVHHVLRTNRKLDFVQFVLAMASVLLKCYSTKTCQLCVRLNK